MNTIIHDLTLDFSENRSLQVVKLKQNDDALTHIRLTLTHNGSQIQIDSAEETAKVNVSVNGVAVVVENNCSIVGNKIEFNVTEEMTTLSGEGLCDVKISRNGFNVYTATFRLLIEPSVVSTDTPEIVSTTDFVKNFAEQTSLDWATYIISSFGAMYPEYGKNTITWNVDSDYSPTETQSYFISTTALDVNSDGLLITQNGNLLLRDWYSFDFTHQVTGAVRIIFNNTHVHLSSGDTVKFLIYKKSTSGGGIISSVQNTISNTLTDSITGTVEEEE